MALRLTVNDKKKLQRINANVRAKNNRLKNKYNVDYSLPVLNIKNVKNRKQLNDYYDQARRYLRGYGNKFRKNMFGVVASNYEIQKARRTAERVSQERERRFRKIDTEMFRSRGKKTDSSLRQRQLMGDDRYDIFDPVSFNFNAMKTRKQFINKVNKLNEQLDPSYYDKKNEQLKNNILNAMVNAWGVEKSKKARDFVNSLDEEEVLSLYLKEDVFDFSYVYDPNDVDRLVDIFEATFNL